MRYFLTLKPFPEKEVTVGDYCQAERQCGFTPKLNRNHPQYHLTPATAAFNCGPISGRIEYK